MKYRALRAVYGDQGHKSPGDVFEVPDFMVKEMQHLEAAGVIERFRAPVNRKAFTVYENKMVVPEANKLAGSPVVPPVRVKK